MNRWLTSAFVMLSLCLPALAAKQTFKNCVSQEMPGLGATENKIGPIKIQAQFENDQLFVQFAGKYGARQQKDVDESIKVERVNAISTEGKWIFNLNGQTKSEVGTISVNVALQDDSSKGYLFVQNMSKSAWEGRLICGLNANDFFKPAEGRLTDKKGASLYTFDEDEPNKSNCNAGCAKTWPPLTVQAETLVEAPLSVVKRADGSFQLAHTEKPLYYYAGDRKIGDTNGDGLGGVWHLLK